MERQYTVCGRMERSSPVDGQMERPPMGQVMSGPGGSAHVDDTDVSHRTRGHRTAVPAGVLDQSLRTYLDKGRTCTVLWY